ncbi:hypothetical protein K435DRAFT_814239 [Dendrothele bispora CBS 962.96]|uniref:Uncharacterized protein n=1 Tax=Dendrothele bispora (strain CBS 962.96) TaxID=1314807 RepID=A0A4S8KJG4_DENBC|nr:hypothetical protein K435DRAFT_814239 [Dendrothele bispora CBS 962.96]
MIARRDEFTDNSHSDMGPTMTVIPIGNADDGAATTTHRLEALDTEYSNTLIGVHSLQTLTVMTPPPPPPADYMKVGSTNVATPILEAMANALNKFLPLPSQWNVPIPVQFLALDQARLPEVVMTTPVLPPTPKRGLQGVKSGDGERSNGQKRICNKARRGSVNSVMMENSMKKAQSSGSKVVDQQEVLLKVRAQTPK